MSISRVVFFPYISGEDTQLNPNGKGSEWCLRDYALGIAVGTAAVAAAPLALSAAGFTAGGVAAGSLAASVQSAAYGATVGSGTLFAGLQSAGAAGIGVGAKVAIGSFVGAVTTYIKSKVSPCHEELACASGGKK